MTANVVIADPAHFNWLPVPDAKDVDRKYLGSFSERAMWIELIRLQPSADWSSTDPRGRRLVVVLSGTGTAADTPYAHLTALQVSPAETLRLSAETETELFVIGLPPVILPSHESEQFDFVEITDTDS